MARKACSRKSCRRGVVVRRRSRYPVRRGGSLGSWLRKAGRFLKKHRVASRGAAYLGKSGTAPWMKYVAPIVSTMGYGLSRGGALKRSGAGRKRVQYRRRR